jgi:hypothetical protein
MTLQHGIVTSAENGTSLRKTLVELRRPFAKRAFHLHGNLADGRRQRAEKAVLGLFAPLAIAQRHLVIGVGSDQRRQSRIGGGQPQRERGQRIGRHPGNMIHTEGLQLSIADMNVIEGIGE